MDGYYSVRFRDGTISLTNWTDEMIDDEKVQEAKRLLEQLGYTVIKEEEISDYIDIIDIDDTSKL
jgi:hypothetical protein